MNQLRLSELQNQNIDCIDENNIPTEELSSFELRIITNCAYLEKDNTKYYIYSEVTHQLKRNHLEETILKLDTVTHLTVTAETKLYYGA